MSKYLSLLLAGCLMLASFNGYSAATYSMKITITKPKGSAAELVSKNKALPTTIPFSPCTLAKQDVLSFNLIYNAGKTAADLMDVYFFFYNPSAEGTADSPKVWALTSAAVNAPIALIPYADVVDIDEEKVYLSAFDNLGGEIKELLLRSYIKFDGLNTGTWVLVGIIADSGEPVEFDNVSTWKAWDAAPFVIGSPWTDAVLGDCVDE